MKEINFNPSKKCKPGKGRSEASIKQQKEASRIYSAKKRERLLEQGLTSRGKTIRQCSNTDNYYDPINIWLTKVWK